MTQPPIKKIPDEFKANLAVKDFFSRLVNAVYFLWADYTNGRMRFKKYTVSTLPEAAGNERRIIYVSDESGGVTLAFSDGTNWRRVQDIAVVS